MKEKKVFVYLYDHAGAFQGFQNQDLEVLDVINLSFGTIVDGRLSLDSVPHRKEIIEEAHKKNVKVVLAIGGWGVDGFSDAVYSEESRMIFLDSIIDAVKKEQFDGIDIDWEYPGTGAGGLKHHDEDVANLTIFMKELRAALKAIREDMIVSMAVANGVWAAKKYYNIKDLSDTLDYLHLMSYDMIHYATDANPDVKITHHSNMYASKFSVTSAEEGVKAYVAEGMPIDKIVLGIAFYAHVFETEEASDIGMLSSSVREKKRTISFRKLTEEVLVNPEVQIYFDGEAKASWAYGNNTVYSYDSVEAIFSKCDYVKNKGLAGVMVWEYCKDDANSTLVRAIGSSLKN